MTNAKHWLLVGMSIGYVCLGMAQEKGLIIGHRGGRFEFEENTLAAFRDSYAAGTRGFETDVRMTKDGVLVILHNDTVDEIFQGHGSVEDMTAEEIRRLSSRKGGQPLLFLDELVAFLADKPGLYVEFEMKTSNRKLYPDERIEPYCRAIHAAVTARQPNGSVYTLTSFDTRALKFLHDIFPGTDIGLISSGPVCPEIVKKAKALGSKRIACAKDTTSRSAVAAAQKEGMIVNGWPNATIQDLALSAGLGFDVICSDTPVKMNAWKKAFPSK